MKPRHLHVAAALCAAGIIAAGGAFFWRQNAERELRLALNQYGETRNLVARYEDLRARAHKRPSQAAAQTLFSAVNKRCDELHLSECMESLRPSTSRREGADALDLRMRGLYLGETMRWLQSLEAMPDTNIAVLTLRRTDRRLLDLDLRLERATAAAQERAP